jgi:hypothetical protein
MGYRTLHQNQYNLIFYVKYSQVKNNGNSIRSNRNGILVEKQYQLNSFHRNAISVEKDNVM